LNDSPADWVENAASIKVSETDFYKTGKVPTNGVIVLEHCWRLESVDPL
jgi:hypothetical protein